MSLSSSRTRTEKRLKNPKAAFSPGGTSLESAVEDEDEGPFEFRVDLSLMQGQAKTEAQAWSQRFSPVPVFDPSQVITLTEYFKQKQEDPS